MILDILTALFMVSSLFLIFLMIAEWRRDVLHGHYVAGSTGRNNLRLRPIGRDEFAVIENGHSIGRIIFAGEASNPLWLWDITFPGHNASGTALSLAEAKLKFQRVWTKRKAGPSEPR